MYVYIQYNIQTISIRSMMHTFQLTLQCNDDSNRVAVVVLHLNANCLLNCVFNFVHIYIYICIFVYNISIYNI